MQNAHFHKTKQKSNQLPRNSIFQMKIIALYLRLKCKQIWFIFYYDVFSINRTSKQKKNRSLQMIVDETNICYICTLIINQYYWGKFQKPHVSAQFCKTCPLNFSFFSFKKRLNIWDNFYDEKGHIQVLLRCWLCLWYFYVLRNIIHSNLVHRRPRTKASYSCYVHGFFSKNVRW